MKFKGEPKYITKREMCISGFWCPRHTEEQFQWVKDSGLTHIYIEKKYGDHGTPEFMKALDCCEKVGLKAIPQRYDYNKPLFADPADYSGYSCVAGQNVYDEPSKDQIDNIIKKDLEEFNKRYKGRTDINFYTNLFGHYASTKQTGFEDYAEYVDYFGKTISKNIEVGEKIICVDSYPVCQDKDSGENYVLEGHLFSIECVANTARRYDLVPYFFIQTMSFGNRNRAPKQAEFNLQVYACLAFGIRGIHEFTYMTPQEEPGGEFTFDRNGVEQTAMIDRQGNKTERWYFAKNINEELKRLQDVYLSFKWKGVIAYKGEELCYTKDFEWLREPLKSHHRVREFHNSADTILGCFEDEKGYEGFMVVPYLETTINHKPRVDITFNECDSAVLYVHGEKRVVKLDNGRLSLNIESGNGVFVIPFIE